MFGSEGRVKVGDFGLVTAAEKDDEQLKRSIKTGTRSYMSPEQVCRFITCHVSFHVLLMFLLFSMFSALSPMIKNWIFLLWVSSTLNFSGNLEL